MDNRERSTRDRREDAEALEAQGGAPLPHPPAAPGPARRPVRLTPLPSAFERRAPSSGSPLVRVRTYEELDGGEGRGVFFRPHRHSAADLAPLSCRVLVSVAGVEYECPLWDVSQNGAALVWPSDLAVHPRERLHVALRFDDHEPFRGEAEVGSIRQQDGATVVGISFHDFLLDVDEILELRNVQSWHRGASSSRLEQRPWAMPGCERYKALLAELRLFYEDSRRQVDALEAALPWHVLHGEDNVARRKLLQHLRGSFVEDAVKLTEAVDGALRAIPGSFANPVAKEWSRRHVHDFIMMSPCCHRALHKPFGYPGDYEVMNFIYERNFEGADLFARTVQLGFAHIRSSKAVRGRKDFVKEQLHALLRERARSRRPVRILSIAAGPAQELAELFSELEEVPVPVEIVLFDQDKNALAHAWRRLSSLVDPRFAGTVRLTFLHDSIKRLLRDSDLFRQFGKFDLAYSCGLYDYLHQRTAVGLTRQLAATLAPEGRLLVANMVDNASRWLLEFHLDWPLVYRTRDELREVAQRAEPRAQVRILEESSGTNPFFELTRS
jgi:extracellular factor (EF) 3-hydroxypalmitic acid methyl ester biosynthesis protein